MKLKAGPVMRICELVVHQLMPAQNTDFQMYSFLYYYDCYDLLLLINGALESSSVVWRERERERE